MESNQKKRAIVSFDKMNDELRAAFYEKYPSGKQECIPDVEKIDKPDGTSLFVVTVETETAIYLVKIDIKVDSAEDVGKWLDEEGGDDDDTSVPSSEGGSPALPDDNINQYDTGDDSAEGE